MESAATAPRVHLSYKTGSTTPATTTTPTTSTTMSSPLSELPSSPCPSRTRPIAAGRGFINLDPMNVGDGGEDEDDDLINLSTF